MPSLPRAAIGFEPRQVVQGTYETDGRDYKLEMRFMHETWIPRSNAKPTWVIMQSQGLRGVTPTDEAAWRRDGSPTAFNEKCRRFPRLCKFRPQPPTAGQRPPGSGVGYLGNSDVTLAQLQRLPTDPGRLRKALLKRLSGGNAKIDNNIVLFEMGRHIITELPVTPQVRAAAYRMMAALPGGRAQADVRDALGRPGVAVCRIGEDEGIEERLIIDPKTGMALATERVRVKARSGADPARQRIGQVVGYELLETVGWTDERPRLPKRRLPPGPVG